MREINKIAESLFEKIRDRFEDVSLGDEKAKAVQDPEKARFFNFDYIVDGKSFGNITMSLIDERSLKIYFSKNITNDLDEHEKQHWYKFLRELREFAKRNLLNFEPRDITRSTLKHRDIQQQSKSDATFDKDEVIGESRLYGTSRSSYENEGPVRIIVRHTAHIDPEQRGARSRKIGAIYLETADGERRKLCLNSLKYARAMARHISEGGLLEDDLGQHITEMASELSKLRPFKNSVRRRTFEDSETQQMVEAAFEYHGLLNNTLQRMSGKKGYAHCKEQFEATSTSYIPEDDINLDEMKERFIKRVFNEKMTDALPLVQKAYKMKKENKFAKQFESWANSVVEGWDEDEEGVKQWGIEPINADDLIDALSNEIPVGVDAVNAINAIGDIIQNDELKAKLVEISKVDPNTDARDAIMDWLQENVPAVFQEVIDEIGDVEPNEPNEREEQYQQGEEGDVNSMAEDIASDAADDPANQSKPEFNSTYGSGNDGEDGMVNDQYNQFNEHEGDDCSEAIQSAIIRRITRQHLDLLKEYGPKAIMDAAEHVAWAVGSVNEIGSSDVSAWVQEVIDMLEHSNEVEEDQYNDDYSMEEAVGDDYVNRGEKMARAGARQMPKEPSLLNKLKSIPKGAKAWVKGQPDDDKSLGISEMRRLAGLE